MNTVVVFDLGKVLVDFDYSIAARKIAARCKKTLPEITAVIAQSRFITDYEAGKLTRPEFFKHVQGVTGFGGTLDEFGEFFADIFTEIPPMIELHAELRRRAYQTYIFSNTNDLAVEHIQRNFPFFKNFDGYIYSYAVGAMKPEAKIYESLEKLARRRGGEIVYLDDRPENVAAGAMRGWQSILHETPEKSCQALATLGIL
ncbi:MAG: HAD family phosphatase [Verrucomicrobiia bacterium]